MVQVEITFGFRWTFSWHRRNSLRIFCSCAHLCHDIDRTADPEWRNTIKSKNEKKSRKRWPTKREKKPPSKWLKCEKSELREKSIIWVKLCCCENNTHTFAHATIVVVFVDKKPEWFWIAKRCVSLPMSVCVCASSTRSSSCRLILSSFFLLAWILHTFCVHWHHFFLGSESWWWENFFVRKTHFETKKNWSQRTGGTKKNRHAQR